ncbi:hypothetical protein HanXRQr2_Chr08g0359531 [Helianthus annuus]|uniref:Uncharacterized protein n=1 Tax=Helianthus annuus TaxID=4232 RepID=A0A9K3IIL7_HELAN|nr:hypothetical protein HanXRQr2_Chr08g0359531 [Helianthus annuus]KAJ0903262.1 hypothetical protein HanPSC8_Chr08g0347041 [Helianthus annuus]
MEFASWSHMNHTYTESLKIWIENAFNVRTDDVYFVRKCTLVIAFCTTANFRLNFVYNRFVK